MMADRIGQRVGDYRLIRFLGQGGFGEVYLGTHVKEGTQAAVKLLTARMGANELKQFVKEASTAARLKHPHIVQLLDFGISRDDTPYLITTYAPDGTLRHRHPSGTRLPIETVLNYVKSIAQALQYMHNDRRIHRDIKPDNILIDSNQEVLLADFGITIEAYATGYIGLQEDANGTIAYSAPEQIRKQAQPASDQYSLAIMVYEWLCGTLPFQGNVIQVMYQQLEVAPPSFKEQGQEIDSSIEQVIMKALAKKPERRYDSAEAFAVALEQAALLAILLEQARKKEPSLPDITIPFIKFERWLDGGYNGILLARRTDTSEQVAVKIDFKRGSYYDDTGFQHETTLRRSLRHPHIVRFIYAGQTEQVDYYLMEYCDGGNLNNLLERQDNKISPLSLQEGGPLLLQALKGLAYLHASGIVHRVLSPYKILVSGTNGQRRAKITGFKYAKSLTENHWFDEVDHTFGSTGSLAFTSRDAFNFTDYQCTSDVWSMGAICYWVFTGKLSRELKQNEDPIDMILRNEHIPIRQRDPHIPRAIGKVIDRSMAPKTTDRYQNAGEMCTAFELALRYEGL